MGNQEPGIMDYVHLRGVEIIHQIQHTFRHHVDLMQILTRVGDPRYAFLIYFPLAYCLHQATGTRVLWIACLSEWLNGVLKWILHGQRPYWWVNEVKLHDNVLNIPSLEQYSLTCETGPGSPSGHAMVTSAVLYSIGTSFMQHGIQQAKAVERVLVWVSFTVVLVAVNVSRLFIATHFPHQVVAGSLTGILLAEVVKHEYTSGLTFKHYAIWCIVLVIGVCVTYFGISILSLDPLWSLTLAKKWCANPEWVHPDTTPFFTFTRDVSSLLEWIPEAVTEAVFVGRQPLTWSQSSRTHVREHSPPQSFPNEPRGQGVLQKSPKYPGTQAADIVKYYWEINQASREEMGDNYCILYFLMTKCL
ncbi:glucose-6-phosphatase 2-like isoform X2 [Ostrea edulis]|uniref:glucose-6-phosphatase 2-like isoform X2 n=1 Tax=Ostrea edulis TaxID=37623 RepID=UPI0024AE9AA7|nr:glucose-6-phosphatase 2-like isoform X2 [Ostrea edulis]